MSGASAPERTDRSARVATPGSATSRTSGEAARARQEPDSAALPDGHETLQTSIFSPSRGGAGDRLLRFAYRIGIAGPMLAAPFGRSGKPRLLAVVTTPLPGNRVAGTALRAGHFLVHGTKLAIQEVDFGPVGRLTRPAAQVVHSFSWLADLEASAACEEVAPLAESLLRSWLVANGDPPRRPLREGAWRVDRTGWRVLNWLVHAPLLLSSDDPAQRRRTLEALAANAQWLDRHIRHAEDDLAAVAGWCGIAAAGLLLPGGRARLLYGEAGLLHALGEIVGDNGGALSRSPLGQMEAIELLVKLRACYRATRRDPPSAVEQAIAMLVPPLLALIHGDGSLGSWQGGWAVDGGAVRALIEASGIRARPPVAVGQWGYQRVTAQKTVLQFDAAPPPLPRFARTGCASTLAFELSHGAERLVVNCGGAAAAGCSVPLRLEQSLRGSAAHSTLTLDDSNSTAVLTEGKLGKGVAEVEFDRQIVNGGQGSRLEGTQLAASHDGYSPRFGLLHRRTLTLRHDGAELRGEDRLVPVGHKRKRAKIRVAIRFHLGPGIEADLLPDARSVGLALPDGGYWLFRAETGTLTLDDSLWVDGQGRPVAIKQVVIDDVVAHEGGKFAWLFRKIS